MIKMPLRTSLHRKPESGKWTRRWSKRKEVLSVNMISLPLGDFRHLSHISSDSGVDRSFGDLSFLQAGHSLLLKSSQSEQNLFLACAPPPKPPRLNPEEERRSPVWEDAPVVQKQKCSSMPLLDSEEVEEQHLHREPANSPGRGSLSSGRDSMQTNSEESQPDETDTGFTFNLDLGPSILDAVLEVMDDLHH
ncbi:cdc42 effector protein 3 [Misgurnus anguillicaudatus]|uniref:cdc42 effector protein 3 n=1 Tax=Misgurnus anguillicaudatus TaxID=75329 RepID=UPI003CCF79E0